MQGFAAHCPQVAASRMRMCAPVRVDAVAVLEQFLLDVDRRQPDVRHLNALQKR
jgi:hypothetical protein